MKEITFSGKILNFGRKQVEFTDEIDQIKIDDHRIYVLLDIPLRQELSFDDFHNVFCYSTNGEKLWQIGDRPIDDEEVYTMFNFDDGFVYANDFLGRRYSVDKNTGEIRGMIIAN
jgi:hypothetical protein